MFKRKTSQWLLQAQNTKHPLLLRDMTPQDNNNIIASFLRKKIGSKELNGIVSPDDEIFTPEIFFRQNISKKLESIGVIDICDLIDATKLPGDILEYQLKKYLQEVKGFFDLIKRKFFTPQGGKRELKKFLSSSTSFDLKYLLNSLYWTEEHLESILDLIADDGEFYGYIDPITLRLYNFTFLDFTSAKNMKKKMDRLRRFITTSFLLNSEISISDICKLTRLSKEDCLDLLKEHRNEIQFIFSSNFEFLYPTINIIKQVLKDIVVYHTIPIDFWLMRLDVDRSDFISFLKRINHSLKGSLSQDDFEIEALSDWFKTGIDVEGLANTLNLESLELLNLIVELAQVLHFRIIAGETADPFLVKGVKDFDIFCQIDTSSYSNPTIYFECQNCRRVMCSNCRSTGSKHECPFCGNISAFIIDLPRHCKHCNVNYTHSFNLASTEKCYFCQKGPMKVGWSREGDFSIPKLKLDHKIAKVIEQSDKPNIPIKEIISITGYTDKETISLLEKNILNGNIKGRIDIRKLLLELSLDKKMFTCSVCELSRTESGKFTCINCGSSVCMNCFNEMSIVGMTFCSECGGKLQQINL
ncbi:MAG: hypothetical protein ACFFAU_06435 [Candidatus Hodarchaeota archaeon]